MKQLIIKAKGEEAYEFIARHLGPDLENCLVLSTTNAFNIENQTTGPFKNIVNLHRINDIKKINSFYAAVNAQLLPGGIFICCVETKNIRKARILAKFPPILNHIYYFLDFILKRVLPKLRATKWIYFLLTGGRNRVLSYTESLGRLYYCGFQYVEEKIINKNLYIAARKVSETVSDEELPYGFLFRMKRIGRNGKPIWVYKLRTMHAYSEFLQQFIYERNKLAEGGKLKNDIRVTTLGKFLRKFWIDEIPMIINMLKGEIKLVGVRPLSQHYLGLYNERLQHKRLEHKPGLIPPFYADLPKTLEEIQDSEYRYLEAYEKAPLRTDLHYLFRALNNILIRRARSK
jgi:lipopolysaccharide/colanic/teichoic acid biosynthesis glycosyltransferase